MKNILKATEEPPDRNISKEQNRTLPARHCCTFGGSGESIKMSQVHQQQQRIRQRLRRHLVGGSHSLARRLAKIRRRLVNGRPEMSNIDSSEAEADQVSVVPEAAPDSAVGPPVMTTTRRRRSGIATVSVRPSLSFPITEDEEPQDEDQVNNNSIPNGDDTGNINSDNRSLAERWRRISDVGPRRPRPDLGRSKSESNDRTCEVVTAAAGSSRKFSVDSSGILKQNHPHHHRRSSSSRRRKSVSFSRKNSVFMFETPVEVKEDEDDEKEGAKAGSPDDNDPGVDRSLVPTFVFPGNRRNFGTEFRF